MRGIQRLIRRENTLWETKSRTNQPVVQMVVEDGYMPLISVDLTVIPLISSSTKRSFIKRIRREVEKVSLVSLDH